MRLAFLLALSISLSSFAFFWQQGATNLYQDGIAHLNIARRLTDCLNPGYKQLGSVWLPLPHVLAAPLAASDYLWRSGLAGSLISMASFIGSVLLVAALARRLFPAARAEVIAWGAAAAFALNPNLLYLQSTPLTEPLFIFLFLATVYWLARWSESRRRRDLLIAALSNTLAALARYEGWFLILPAAVYVCARSGRRRMVQALIYFSVAAAGPLYWLLHNALIFHNPLEFYSGPYSSQAIYAEQIRRFGFRYPTDHNLALSLLYYSAAAAICAGPILAAISIAGFMLSFVDGSSRRGLALLLLSPFPFYVLSLYTANTGIYVPYFPPGTLFNLRYGAALAPAAAVASAYLIARLGRAAPLTLAILLSLQIVLPLRHGLSGILLYQEPARNSARYLAACRELAREMRVRYDGGLVLIEMRLLGPAAASSGLTLSRFIHECNSWTWRTARSRPVARWAVATEGDLVNLCLKSNPVLGRAYSMVDVIEKPVLGKVYIYQRKGARIKPWRIGERAR